MAFALATAAAILAFLSSIGAALILLFVALGLFIASAATALSGSAGLSVAADSLANAAFLAFARATAAAIFAFLSSILSAE